MEKRNWQVDYVIEEATEEQAERILDKLVIAISDEGLIGGGGMSAISSKQSKGDEG